LLIAATPTSPHPTTQPGAFPSALVRAHCFLQAGRVWFALQAGALLSVLPSLSGRDQCSSLGAPWPQNNTDCKEVLPNFRINQLSQIASELKNKNSNK